MDTGEGQPQPSTNPFDENYVDPDDETTKEEATYEAILTKEEVLSDMAWGLKDFDPITYVFNRFPGSVSKGHLEKFTEDLIDIHSHVVEKLNGALLDSFGDFVEGMSTIRDLGDDLQASALLCRTARGLLLHSNERLTDGSLRVLGNHSRRILLLTVLKMLQTIVEMTEGLNSIDTLIEKEEYAKAAKQCITFKNKVSKFSSYECLRHVPESLKEKYRRILKLVDNQLGAVCRHFDEESFVKICAVYIELGFSEKKLVAKIQSHLVSLTRELVDNCHGNSGNGNPSEITAENREKCLFSLVWEFSELVYQILMMNGFLKAFIEDKTILDDPKLQKYDGRMKLKIKSFMKKLHSAIFKKVDFLLDIICSKVLLLVEGFVENLTLESFITVVENLSKFADIIEDYFSSDSTVIVDSIKLLAKAFLEKFHQAQMDVVSTLLENETWKICPIPAKFTLMGIPEVKVFIEYGNRYATRREYKRSKKAGENIPENEIEERMMRFADLMSQDGNPFPNPNTNRKEGENGDENDEYALQQEYKLLGNEQREADISGVRMVKLDRDSAKNTSRRELFNPTLNIEKMTIVSSTLNEVHTYGKYLQLIQYLSPHYTVEAFALLIELFEYHMLTVFRFFAPALISTLISPTLRVSINEILRHFESSEYKNTILPTLSSMVDIESEETLYGLPERVAAVESLSFLGDILNAIRPVFLTLSDDAEYVKSLYETRVGVLKDIRTSVLKLIVSKTIQPSMLVSAIAGQRWDMREIGTTHSHYVDVVAATLKSLNLKMTTNLINPHIQAVIWGLVSDSLLLAMVEGFSRVKKCSSEGRGQMKHDLVNLKTNIDIWTKNLPSVPESENSSQEPIFMKADMYIRAYYLPQEEMIKFARENTYEYTPKQLVAVATTGLAAQQMKRKARIDFINDVETASRKKSSVYLSIRGYQNDQ